MLPSFEHAFKLRGYLERVDAIEPIDARPSYACEVRVVDLDSVRAVKARLAGDSHMPALSNLFATLGDPTRLRLLAALAHAPLCTCDLAAVVGVTESAVSHQLRLLKEQRLVRSRREGKRMMHELADDHVRALLEVADEHVREAAP